MEQFTLTQCMRLLEVNQHRLQKLIEGLRIVPEGSITSHGKVKLINADDLERLRHALATTVQPRAMQSIDNTIWERFQVLERRVAALEAKQSTNRPIPTSISVSSSHPPTKHDTGAALPDGLEGIPRFAGRHGIPDSTAMHAITTGHIPTVPLDLWIGSVHYKQALDTNGQRTLVAHFRHHQRYHSCEMDECMCHETSQ